MERKPLSTKIDNSLQKETKKLAIDLERQFMIFWKKLYVIFCGNTKKIPSSFQYRNVKPCL